MIRNALESEKSTIYRIWKEMFSFDDQGYTDYYFSELFQAKDTLVYEVDGKIVSTLQKKGHVMILKFPGIFLAMEKIKLKLLCARQF